MTKKRTERGWRANGSFPLFHFQNKPTCLLYFNVALNRIYAAEYIRFITKLRWVAAWSFISSPDFLETGNLFVYLSPEDVAHIGPASGQSFFSIFSFWFSITWFCFKHSEHSKNILVLFLG